MRMVRTLPRVPRRLLVGILCAAPFLAPRISMAEQPAPARPAYISLGDFTINLPGQRDQLSYIVISITVEAAPESASDLRAVEPLLKETVMFRLMAMADSGVLQPGHTDPMIVKQGLLSSLTALHDGQVRNVLITRLLYG
jgi:flagellar basal body-associated protein FliL